MEGCGNNKYNPNLHYDSILHHYWKGDVIEYIESEFESNTANALIKGISIDSNVENGLKSEEEITDFLSAFEEEDFVNDFVKTHNEITYSNDEDTSDLTVYSFYTDLGGVRVEYEKMVNGFKQEIIERTLLKNGKLINPDLINDNLYNYKLELLSHLYEYVSPGKSIPDFNSEEDFTIFMKRVLSRVYNKGRFDESGEYSQYINDFIKLLYFDRLLEDEIDYITIKPEYALTGTYGKDMYVSSGPFNYKDRFSTYDETAGTEDYTSSFVKLLLDYFKDSNGRSITLARFNAVSGQVIEWAESEGSDVQELLYSGLDEAVNIENDKSKFSILLDKFIANASITSEVRSAAEAINNNIFKNEELDDKIKRIFANQFITSIRYSYLGYRIVYDSDSKEKGPNAFRFVSDLLESDLINRQTYSIQRIIKNRVYQLRSNPEMLQELIDKYDIDINSTSIVLNSKNESEVKLTTDKGFSELPYKVEIKYNKDFNRYTFSVNRAIDNSSIRSKQVSDDFVKSFIEDVTGLVLPTDFVNVWNTSNPGIDDTMWDSFSRVAFIVLTASTKSSLDSTKNLFGNYEYLYRGEELKLYNYYHDFEPLGKFYSVVLGAEYATVVKNSEGNNLPTSQLRTSIFDVKREIYRLLHTDTLTERSNLRVLNQNTGKYEDISQSATEKVFGSNVLVTNTNAIGTISTRADTRINDSVKISTQLLPEEVLQEAIAVDFYGNLTGNNSLIKERKKKHKSKFTDTSVWIQPIAYSDKRTHFIVEFKLNNILLNGKRMSDLITKISSFDSTRQENINVLEEGIRKVRLDKYEKQALNLIERFSKTLGWGLQRLEGESVLNYFIRASKKLKEFSITYGKDAEKELQKRFGDAADLYVSDYNVLGNKEITFNITLAAQLKANQTLADFKNRMNREKLKFIRDLIDIGFALDPNVNVSWKPIFKDLKVGHEEWFDVIDGSMKLFRAVKDGKEITIDWTDLNDVDWDSIDFTLNPILEGFFYTDIFLSGQFNDLLFGDVNGYKVKHEAFQLRSSKDLFNFLEDKEVSKEFLDYLSEDEASRLTDMSKRTVSAGASKIHFAQGYKYGIGSHMKLMTLHDIKAEVFNFVGNKDSIDAQDGGAFCHPIFSREQNESLLDRRVGNQKKKTFANWIDPETGTAGELKFAEYVLTNEWRRIGSEVTDFSFENLYKLMSSLENRKIRNINFSKYYGKSKYFNKDEENITYTQDLYRYNLDTLMHERLVEIKQDAKGIRAVWQYYNEDGTPFDDPTGSNTYEEPLISNTIYGIDQLFGGAYCEVWDENFGKFIWSEANLDILHTIVAEEELKDSFIALAVNSSAIKTGARNLNNIDILKYGNASLPKWFEVSTLHYGIQMNPDHDIEDTRGVREMTQMISALVQNGYLMGDVNEIYQMIGSVALDSVKAVIDAVDSNDEDKIYQIIGEALVKAFDTNQKDVLGLAQSFIAMANRDLKTKSYKTRIPFSANTIKGSFQATITSFLNKDAIRRRFAGLGAIQTPSFGGIQYFQYNGENLNWVEFCKAVGGRQNAIKLVTDKSWNGMSFNNITIVPINPLDISLNDTIVYRDEFGEAKEVFVSNPTILYDFKYRNENGRNLYKWTVKPRNFAGSEIMFTVNGKQYSIYDTDLVRIIDDLSTLSKEISANLKEKGTRDNSYFTTTVNPKTKQSIIVLSTKGTLLFDLIKNQFGIKYDDINIFNDDEILYEIFQLAKWNVNNELLPKLSSIYRGDTKKLKVQNAFRSMVNPDENDEVEIVVNNFRPLQVGLGKLSAQKLGLEPGVTINDVFREKQEFFKKRIRRFAEKPGHIDSNLYDAVLYEADGTPTLVMFGGLWNNSDRIDKTIDSFNFKVRGDNYWKNGIDFGSRLGKHFLEYVDEFGKSWNVVVVDNWSAFDELRNNGQYVNEIFNYTKNNYKDIIQYTYRHNFNSKGELISQIGRDAVGRPFVERTSDGDWYLVNDESINNLNKAEKDRQKRYINREANNKWEAFNLQLQIIIDRIPSQSMQSFTSADVVMLLDTDENAVVMSAFLAWLQGSDYDIDKGFIMAYEIGDDGKIITPSKLDRYYSAVNIFELPLPNKKKFDFKLLKDYNKEDGSYTYITLDEVPFSISGNRRIIPIELINRILLGGTNVVFDDEFETPDNIGTKNRIIELIKLHQDSVNLPSARKTAGYRNRIVYRINKLLRDPITQGNLNLPVDEAMKQLKNNIPDPEYRSELYRTWDNPATKYKIQRDNMVGRDVIGISAVSLKAFFAETTYANNVILDIINLVEEYKSKLGNTNVHDVNLGNNIVKLLQKICFDAKFIKDPYISSNIATISNLRFVKLLRSSIQNLEIKVNPNLLNTPRLTSLRTYLSKDEKGNPKIEIDGAYLNLNSLVHDLNIYANGTAKNPKDANMTLSGYTSLATDNAKELKLVKMNATSQFADFHTYMSITGTRPKDVINFMASPAFDIIRRYSERSVLDPGTNWFNTENALNFLLDRKTLPIIKDYVFKKILTTYKENPESGASLFNRPIERDGSFVDIGFNNYQLFRIYLEAKRFSKNPSLYNTNFKESDVEEIRSTIESLIEENSDNVVNAIYNLLRIDPTANIILLRTLRAGFESAKDTSEPDEIDPELLYERQFYEDEADVYDEEDAYYDQDEYFEIGDLTKSDWLQAYRYVKNYLIPKNKALVKLGYDNVDDNPIKIKYLALEKVLKATKEQQMIGSILGVNGGLDTNDYDEYKNVRKVEKFINDKYIDYMKINPNEKFEVFDFVKFLDKNNVDYRTRQIEYYDKVAETINILDLIVSIPHFNAMLQMIPLNRYLIQRSVALKMERELADKLVHADKPEIVNGFNRGDIKTLTKKEWSVIRNYVNDLLILKWFEQQSDLKIQIPKGMRYYDKGYAQINEAITDLDGNSIELILNRSLANLDGLATFKNLMDNHIIPELKKAFPNNAFLSDILMGNVRNNVLDRLQTFYRLSFDVSEVSKNSALQLKYENISRAFNEISKRYLPPEMEEKYGRWKIGDLFFLYNLYVHKDGFSSQAFTRLFEDSNTISNKFAFNKQFYDYLSKLDSGQIDYRDLFKKELGYDSNPKSNTASFFLNDLRIKMSIFENSKYNYNIEAVGKGESYELYLYNEDGQQIPVKLYNPRLNPSDYTIWLPYRILNSDSFKVEARKELGLQQDRTLSGAEDELISSTVIKTIINRINEIAADSGNPEIINIIREEELAKMYETKQGPIYFSDADDFARTKNAKGFIYNGKIYINLQNANISDPVHEFLHIILAAMKGSGDVNVRRTYYRLLNDVVKENAKDYAEMQSTYNGRRDSDIKEEVFINYLSNGFAAKFEEEMNKAIAEGNFKESDLIEFTISAINNLFGSEVPTDIEALVLGNTSIKDIFSLFGNNLPGLTKSRFAEIYLPREELAREIKAKLFKDHKIIYGKNCL